MKALIIAVLLFLHAVVRAQGPTVPAFTLRKPLPARPDLLHMPPAWSYQRLGVFCKLDVQLERRVGIPVLIRLGDVRQVETWEGKGPLALPGPDRHDR